jgi:ferrous iron transport protein A
VNNEVKQDTMLIPLETLRPGEWGEVVDVSGEACWVCRLGELGLREGTRVRVLRNGAPCLLQVGDAKLSLRGECAACVLVRPVS